MIGENLKGNIVVQGLNRVTQHVTEGQLQTFTAALGHFEKNFIVVTFQLTVSHVRN